MDATVTRTDSRACPGGRSGSSSGNASVRVELTGPVRKCASPGCNYAPHTNSAEWNGHVRYCCLACKLGKRHHGERCQKCPATAGRGASGNAVAGGAIARGGRVARGQLAEGVPGQLVENVAGQVGEIAGDVAGNVAGEMATQVAGELAGQAASAVAQHATKHLAAHFVAMALQSGVICVIR